VQSLGIDLSGAMVLRSLVNTLSSGGLGGLQGMLLPLLMAGGDFSDMESMLPLILMGHCGMGGAAGAVPAGGNNMLQMLMLMKMMGGKKEGGSPAINLSKSLGGFFDR
jgi:hypothetical protein